MATSASLVKLLKQQIRQQGTNYREIAEQLGLSESAVKRMFARGNMSLKRLDELCEILALDLHDLLSLMDQNQASVDSLSHEFEQRLVDDPKLLLLAYCMVNQWTIEAVLERYNVTQHEVMRHLAQLDRMKLIELLPGNRVRILAANNFKWIANGPIEKFFRSHVQNEFFSSTFSAENDLHLVKMGDISPTGQQRLIERLRRVGSLFDEIATAERRNPAVKRQGTTMVVALRHWHYGAFAQFEREAPV